MNAALALWVSAFGARSGRNVQLPDPDQPASFLVQGPGESGDAVVPDLRITNPEFSQAVAPLCAVVKSDPNAIVRSNAAVALAEIAPRDERALRILAGAVRDKDLGVRAAAVFSMCRYGPAAMSLVATLLEDFDSETWGQRTYIVAALAAIGTDESREPIARFAGSLRSAGPNARNGVEFALDALGHDWAKHVLPQVYEALGQ